MDDNGTSCNDPESLSHHMEESFAGVISPRRQDGKWILIASSHCSFSLFVGEAANFPSLIHQLRFKTWVSSGEGQQTGTWYTYKEHLYSSLVHICRDAVCFNNDSTLERYSTQCL